MTHVSLHFQWTSTVHSVGNRRCACADPTLVTVGCRSPKAAAGATAAAAAAVPAAATCRQEFEVSVLREIVQVPLVITRTHPHAHGREAVTM